MLLDYILFMLTAVWVMLATNVVNYQKLKENLFINILTILLILHLSFWLFEVFIFIIK